jgi:hypothetical protein
VDNSFLDELQPELQQESMDMAVQPVGVSTTDCEVQVNKEAEVQRTQTESEFMDGTSGLPSDMTLADVAATVRSMPTETFQQVVSRLLTRYGGVAKSQRRELLLAVQAVIFAQRDLISYFQDRLIEAALTPLALQDVAKQRLIAELEQLAHSTVCMV